MSESVCMDGAICVLCRDFTSHSWPAIAYANNSIYMSDKTQARGLGRTVLGGLVLYIPVNSYGHVGTVSSPNHKFFQGKLD